MTLKKEITKKILSLLEKNPQGLSITDIVKFVKINRNTAGRYLENLLLSGQVDMRRFGMAKIYILSQRVPLSAVLSISSDMVVQLDSSLRIIFANEPFLNLISTDSKNLLRKNIEYTPVSLVFDELFTGFIENIRQGIAGREWSGEIALITKDVILFCRIAPTVYEDGRRGVSVILEDITKQKQAERALQESEAKLRSIAENSPDMILLLNQKLDIIFISQTYTLNSDQVCGKSVYNFVPQEFHPAATACFEQVLKTGKPATYGTQYHFPDGTTLFFESTVGPVLQEGGVSALVINARDITERKKTENALRESEERYRQLVDISPDAVLIHIEGKITYLNQAALTMLGAKESSEILGKNVLDLIHPDFRDTVRKNIEKDLNGETTSPTELEMLRVDGTTIVTEGRGVKTTFNGKPAIQVAIRDTTERKRAEVALRESEENYRQLADIAPCAIIVHTNGIITYVNLSAIQILGAKDSSEIIGKNIFVFIHPDCRHALSKIIEIEFNGETPPAEIKLVRVDGTTILVEGRGVDTTIKGKPVRQVAIRDITKYRQTEEKLRESENKYRSIIDHANDGICVIQDNVIKMCNKRAAEFWGDSIENTVGRAFTDFIHPDALSDVVDRYHRKMAGEKLSEMYETVLMRKDGGKFYAELNASIFSYEGKPADLAIIRDTNERKKGRRCVAGN